MFDPKRVDYGSDNRCGRHLCREIAMAIWCVVFAILISALGFRVGGPVSAALFLSFVARERWMMSLGFTVGIYVFSSSQATS